MTPLLTYLDASVLIAATRLAGEISDVALTVLDDPDRVFAASIFLQLEILPKPRLHRRVLELAFYEDYFGRAVAWAYVNEQLMSGALDRASRLGLGPMDALHLEFAISVGAMEFITVERPGKPFFKESAIRVVSLQKA